MPEGDGDLSSGTDREDRADAQSMADACVRRMIADDEFSRWMGMEVTDLSPGDAEVRMTVRPEMVNGFGVAHGGIAYSLADSALAFASNTHGRVTVSIESSIGYPVPVRAGDVLTARSAEESASNRLAFHKVTVTNQDGTVVALMRGTVYRTSRPLLGASGEAE